jgi:hypothetical protein
MAQGMGRVGNELWNYLPSAEGPRLGQPIRENIESGYDELNARLTFGNLVDPIRTNDLRNCSVPAIQVRYAAPVRAHGRGPFHGHFRRVEWGRLISARVLGLGWRFT